MLFVRRHNANTCDSYDIATQTKTNNDTTHTITATDLNVKNVHYYNNEMYFTNGTTGSNSKLTKYNFTTKTSTLLENFATNTFSPDGVNYLDVLQSPIFLELQ